MNIDLNPKCENCYFWVDRYAAYHRDCRKNAPININKEGGAIFPKTAPDDWCGQYMASAKRIDEINEEVKKTGGHDVR